MKARKTREFHQKRKVLTEYRKKFGHIRGSHLKTDTGIEEDTAAAVGGRLEKETNFSEDDETSKGRRRRTKVKKQHWYDTILDRREQDKQKRKEESEAKKKRVVRQEKKRRRTRYKMEQRTRRGQPVMKNQIEHLLKKIKDNKRKENETNI